MISENERLELIRQAEKTNLNNDQMDDLVEWANLVRIENKILDLLFLGQIELAGVRNNNEPVWSTTPEGDENVRRIFGEDSDDYDEEDDEDEDDYDEDEDCEDLSNVEDPEEATRILRNLYEKLQGEKRRSLGADNGKSEWYNSN